MWTCEGCGATTPVQYRWDHECPIIYRVYSPSRRAQMFVTDNPGHAKGRAHALNQGTLTDRGRADWLVQTATPRWENP